MSYIRFSIIGVTLLVSALLTACGGGGGNSGTPVDAKPPITDTSGQYDLQDYLFNESLSVTLSTVSYPVTFYGKADGVQTFQYTDRFVKTLDDTIAWTTDDAPSSTYKITTATIDETVHTANNAVRQMQRFVDVGDVYLNANDETLFGTQNATCQVVDNLTSIDLSTLTGNFSLAAGIYNDVLKVSCVTGFVNQGTVLPHTTLTHYFARGVGVVLVEGSIILFGDVYIIPTL